jgi:formamidopyrimidine-DNA glycosylase
MPELPEVETVRRELAPWIEGRHILSARRRDAPPGPKYADLERADGQRILGVRRRGKFLVGALSGGDELIVHLGMTGRITARDPESHVRVEVALSGRNKNRLYFQDPRRFGRFLVVPAGQYASLPTLAALGPEPLEGGFTADTLYAAIHGSRAPIKALLMGQRVVAGVGNIYCDEALWRARIHPLTPAHKVTRAQTEALHAAIVAVLEAAVAASGTTFSDYRTIAGERGLFAVELQAYGREGEPCLRCGAAMKRIIVGQRSSSFCPACQRRSAQQRKPR